MKIIFVCIENFQEYIIDNIKNLQLFQNTDITVLTNKKFFHLLEPYNVNLYDIADLNNYEYYQRTQLDPFFRNGFWVHCSSRFFYLYSYLKKFQICDCIHLENDVMAYINFDEIKTQFSDTSKIYASYDCERRIIPGLLYIPNYNALGPIIQNYDFSLDDMFNLAKFKEIIEPLPIFINTENHSTNFFNKNYKNCIFDTAAMGQYLGGIDRRNQDGDTRGFVNETCVIKYDKYLFFWIKINDLYVPHILIDGQYIRIINLHLHKKELYKFMADNPIEDKFIKILEKTI